ncbi:dienelactone hydrolase family protein [Paracoccaceae bacterium GXU_MW_L88]
MKYLTLAASLMAGTAMAGEAVTYSAEGRDFEGYMAMAEDAKGTVLIVHDWDGLTQYEKDRADMLAEMGYNAFAVDLYGAGVRPDSVEGNRAETEKLYNDREMMRALTLAGLDAAKEQGMGDAILAGYCFGGAVALEMALAQPEGIVGYASFHGSFGDAVNQDYAGVDVPMRIYHGGADEAVPMSDLAALVEAFEASGTPYKAEVYYGAPHAFSVIGSDRYNEEADKRSWADFDAFLQEEFG